MPQRSSWKLLYLDWRAFKKSSVRAESLIHQVRTISERETRQEINKDKETWGDLMLRDLWDRQAEAIIDAKLGDVYVDS